MEQFWVAFTHVHGVGPARLRHLLAYFGNLKEAWWAEAVDLAESGLPQAAIAHLITLRKSLQPEKLLDEIHRLGAQVVTLADENYPPLLRETEGSPAVLYVKGTLTAQDQRAVAVVGTRKASNYGVEMTRRLVVALTQAGVTIVSGLAHGIDVIAHQEALNAGGRTIAVLGCGIDILYPSNHRHVAEKIIENGALITEFAPGTEPLPVNFPIRNRIISGMTLGTLVVEAPEKSGALQTANFAGEQGRDVFAVPGNVTSPNSMGTNMLIQDGAKLVISAEDILKELNLSQRSAETRQAVKKLMPANPVEARIMELLQTEALHVDEISRECQLSIQETNAILALMELKGLVFQSAPMTYNINT
jgi:DNA processing protein